MTFPIDWAAAARPGDIVLFRFPLTESDTPTKPRPSLILARHEGGRLTLAYGTRIANRSNTGLDLIVQGADLATAGLHHPTRFVAVRRITVADSDPRFDRRPAQSPIIGRLPAMLLHRMTAITAHLGPAMTEDHRRGRPWPAPGRLRTDQRRIATQRGRGPTRETLVVERRRK